MNFPTEDTLSNQQIVASSWSTVKKKIIIVRQELSLLDDPCATIDNWTE